MTVTDDSLHPPQSSSDAENVVSDPIGSLAVKNGKAVQNCVELFLANKRINILHGFSRFANLDTLWLNNNRLTKLNNLDSLKRLKRLYAHNNSITTLKGSLIYIGKFIDTLTLFNNNLQDLHSSLSILSHLRHLEELDMHNNPLSEETNYRLHVIKQLPQLKVLDRHIITDEERLAASKVKALSETLAEEGRPKKSTMKRKASANTIEAERLVAEAISNIATIVKTKRILLKEHFMEDDPRREYVINESLFRKYLNLYQLDYVVESVGINTDFNTLDLLLKKYLAPKPVRSQTLGRDATLSSVNFINYVDFCRDIEPSFNSRDLDNSQRLREAARSIRLGPTVDDKIPLSKTVKGLQKSVTKYKKDLAAKAQSERLAMIKLSEDQLRQQRNAKVPMAKSEKDFMTPENRLDPWEIKELQQLVKSAESYDGKASNISISDLRKVLGDMILCGRVFTTSALEDFIKEEVRQKEALAEFADVDPEAEEEEEEEREPISRFFDAFESETVTIEEFMTAVQFGIEDVPAPEWRNVTVAEAIHKRDTLFKEAEKLNKRVMLLGDSDKEMMARNITRIKEITHRANKLDNIATGQVEHKFNRGKGARTYVRGDSYTVKTLHEVKGFDDENLSDDEEEDLDSKDLLAEEKEEILQERRRTLERTNSLKSRFHLKEDMQKEFRKALHTRRGKNIVTKMHILGKNVSHD